MLTYCNTARGRVACGLGGVLIAVLALACLWAFSPSVTAGDDPLPPPRERAKELSKPKVCPTPGLPDLPTEENSEIIPAAPPGVVTDPVYLQAQKAEQAGDWPEAIRNYSRLGDIFRDSDYKMSLQYTNRANWLKQRHPMQTGSPRLENVAASPPPPSLPMPPQKSESSSVPPPLATESVPPPPLPQTVENKAPAPVPAVYSPPPPPAGPIAPVAAVGVSSPDTPPVPQAQPPVDTQDIKQLVAHLNEIRADRAKLDDKERQTILTIKRKYQEQKQALELMERELRQLGINFDETAPDKAPVPADVPKVKTIR